MSLNLTLIPIMEGRAFFEQQNFIFPTERISFSESGDSQELLENIESLKPKPMPRGKKVVLRERGNDATNKTPYGDRITYVYPIAFRRFKLPQGAHKWDKAVLAFVKSLPSDTPILLFWH